jgi:hypothetical protein
MIGHLSFHSKILANPRGVVATRRSLSHSLHARHSHSGVVRSINSAEITAFARFSAKLIIWRRFHHTRLSVRTERTVPERIGVVKRSAVSTGRLRRSLALHARPIDLVVFQEPSALIVHGNLILEGASRLDAFSVYPVPTWLPGDAPSGTAGTPEVGPPQSSRTRGDAPQVSYAHGR